MFKYISIKAIMSNSLFNYYFHMFSKIHIYIVYTPRNNFLSISLKIRILAYNRKKHVTQKVIPTFSLFSGAININL